MRAFFFFVSLFVFGAAPPALAQLYDDSLAVDHKLKKISQLEYMNAILKQSNRQTTNSTNILDVLGLTMDSRCDEICDTYLVEKRSKKKMLLPSNFDQGVLGLNASPSNNAFAIYSSYDGPEYSSFYFYRAEIISYQVNSGNGLQALEQKSELHLYNWSIEDLLWVDENTLVLKVYDGTKPVGHVKNAYQYFKIQP